MELELAFMKRTDTLVLIAKFIVNHILINILLRSQAHNITTRQIWRCESQISKILLFLIYYYTIYLICFISWSTYSNISFIVGYLNWYIFVSITNNRSLFINYRTLFIIAHYFVIIKGNVKLIEFCPLISDSEYLRFMP